MNGEVAYLDTSAYVKTVIREPESAALRRWLRRSRRQASTSLLRVEAVRAVAPHGAEAVARAREGFRLLTLIRMDDGLADAAADLQGPLRSLDAVHLAGARSLGDDLAAVVTYDQRMAAAAAALGLPVASPGLKP